MDRVAAHGNGQPSPSITSRASARSTTNGASSFGLSLPRLPGRVATPRSAALHRDRVQRSRNVSQCALGGWNIARRISRQRRISSSASRLRGSPVPMRSSVVKRRVRRYLVRLHRRIGVFISDLNTAPTKAGTQPESTSDAIGHGRPDSHSHGSHYRDKAATSTRRQPPHIDRALPIDRIFTARIIGDDLRGVPTGGRWPLRWPRPAWTSPGATGPRPWSRPGARAGAAVGGQHVRGRDPAGQARSPRAGSPSSSARCAPTPRWTGPRGSGSTSRTAWRARW